jgi:hypothetical protein
LPPVCLAPRYKTQGSADPNSSQTAFSYFPRYLAPPKGCSCRLLFDDGSESEDEDESDLRRRRRGEAKEAEGSGEEGWEGEGAAHTGAGDFCFRLSSVHKDYVFSVGSRETARRWADAVEAARTNMIKVKLGHAKMDRSQAYANKRL